MPKSIGNLVNLKEARLDISGNPLKSLPDSIRKVEHALVASSKDEYKLLLEDVGLVSIEGVNTYDSTVIVAKPKSWRASNQEKRAKHEYRVTQRNQGTVKWFKKGFGFIVAEDGADIFVHYTGISGNGNSGFRSLDAGQKV